MKLKVFIFALFLPVALAAGNLFVNGQNKGTISGDVVFTPNGNVRVKLDTGGGGGTPPPEPEPEPTPEPTGCEGKGVSWARDTSLTRFPSFPPPSGNWETFTIFRGRYIAAEFTTGTDDQGKVSFDRHTHALDAEKTVAISKCPGDFTNEVPSSLCHRQSQATSIFFSTQEDSPVWSCKLEPNTRYYLNIAYGRGSGNNLSNTCSTSRCGAIWVFYH